MVGRVRRWMRSIWFLIYDDPVVVEHRGAYFVSLDFSHIPVGRVRGIYSGTSPCPTWGHSLVFWLFRQPTTIPSSHGSPFSPTNTENTWDLKYPELFFLRRLYIFTLGLRLRSPGLHHLGCSPLRAPRLHHLNIFHDFFACGRRGALKEFRAR